MNSNTTTADCVDTSPLEPSKHVNFVQGMVLGVDDFRQEFSWHAGRHRTLARDLAGYGTVSGLRVHIDPKKDPRQVTVEPGLAVTPAGQLARITRGQCADLAAWLARDENKKQKPEPLGSPPRQAVRVFVRLRYADCKLDPVPIPGEPCRTEDEAMQASRIADSWKLHLSFQQPAQREEDAVRALVAWLKSIPLVEHPAQQPDDVVRELRKAADALLGASDLPGDLTLLPPPEDFFIARQDLCDCLCAVLRVWTTELRPRVQERVAAGGGACGCSDAAESSPPASAAPEEDVLLAELWVPVTESNEVIALDSGSPVEVNEDGRPYLLHLRMLQELVTCGPDATGEPALATFATILARSNETLLVWLHHQVALDVNAPGAVGLTLNGASVPEFSLAAVPGTTNVFELVLAGSPPALLGPGARVSVSFDLDLVREPSTGQTLRLALDESYGGYLDLLDSAIVGHTIVGPLSLDDLVDVDAPAAADDRVLTARGGRWVPETVPRVLDDLGDVDIDLTTAVSGDVLTLRDERWRPESVPRSLDDLADVDIAAVSSADGDVLTLRDGRFSPEAVPRSLDELSDVTAPSPKEGEVLTRRGEVWVAEKPKDPVIPPPTPVHGGIIDFKEIVPAGPTWFGPFIHGLPDALAVTIRLAIELREGEFAENTDTVSTWSVQPRLIAAVVPKLGMFYVLLEDTRKEPARPANYRVRWVGVPVTKDLGVVPATPAAIRKVEVKDLRAQFLADMLPREIALGNNKLESVAKRFGLKVEELVQLLKQLKISVNDGVIVLPKP
jgi:hypothetical protein